METHKIKAVVFDLDDTLYPEHDYVVSGFGAVATEFEHVLGPPQPTLRDMVRLFEADRHAKVFDELLRARGIDEDPALVGRMVDCYRAHRPQISLHDDARSILPQLKDRYQLGIITDGRLSTQSLKIDALQISHLFESIIITGELGDGFAKPHVRAFEKMADTLGVAGTECLYVADNAAKDFIAPNALGWTTVQVLRPNGLYHDNRASQGGDARHRIESLLELPQTL